MSDSLVSLHCVHFAYPGNREVLSDCSLRLLRGDAWG